MGRATTAVLLFACHLTTLGVFMYSSMGALDPQGLNPRSPTVSTGSHSQVAPATAPAPAPDWDVQDIYVFGISWLFVVLLRLSVEGLRP
mmetsp:Transcript_3248/g.10470  ORF Transcript_3248/g.10470 Transcript_3248/m.10470 type:complete len:89 (-) Transcript_3248:119-385(-)